MLVRFAHASPRCDSVHVCAAQKLKRAILGPRGLRSWLRSDGQDLSYFLEQQHLLPQPDGQAGACGKLLTYQPLRPSPGMLSADGAVQCWAMDCKTHSHKASADPRRTWTSSCPTASLDTAAAAASTFCSWASLACIMQGCLESSIQPALVIRMLKARCSSSLQQAANQAVSKLGSHSKTATYML